MFKDWFEEVEVVLIKYYVEGNLDLEFVKVEIVEICIILEIEFEYLKWLWMDFVVIFGMCCRVIIGLLFGFFI